MADPDDPALREWRQQEAQLRRIIDKIKLVEKHQPEAIRFIESLIDELLSDDNLDSGA